MIRFFLMNRLEKFRECLDTQIKSLIIYIYIFIHSSSLAFIFALKKKTCRNYLYDICLQ